MADKESIASIIRIPKIPVFRRGENFYSSSGAAKISIFNQILEQTAGAG
jgi:hypothetical protein